MRYAALKMSGGPKDGVEITGEGLSLHFQFCFATIDAEGRLGTHQYRLTNASFDDDTMRALYEYDHTLWESPGSRDGRLRSELLYALGIETEEID